MSLFSRNIIKIKRSSYVKMTALNELGVPYELKAEGHEGKCIQHEIDHLNGISFIDHLSRLKREIIKKKCQKLLKENN